MKTLKALAVALLLPACGVEIEDTLLSDSSEPLSFSTADAALILELANYPGTKLETLDVGAGLDVRAAEHIIYHRDGADYTTLTEDDQRFEQLADLEKLPYVAATALSKMRRFALENPTPKDEAVEGLHFEGWQSQALVFAVNTATERELDVVAGLDSDAAQALLAKRPYTSVTEMGEIDYVGAAALEVLRASSVKYWRWYEAPKGGTFDEVTFEEPVAQAALEIANKATLDQLVENGVWSTGAKRIVDARPYTSLEEVANVYGVGASTMQGLYGYAANY